MTCNKCLNHRKAIRAAAQQRDVGKVVTETLAASKTLVEKTIRGFGRASVKKRTD